MGATKAEAKELADELLKIPPGKVKFYSEGYKERLREIRELRRAAAAITVPLIYSNKPRVGDDRGFAGGGYISGPGTKTSDSIPAWLSNGEFVQRARAVDFYGVDFMRRLNNLQIPKFAGGGHVTVQAPAPSAGLTIDQRGSTFQVHDYRDFMRQNQDRAERASLSMVRSD
jgi:hypothetical protein